MFKTLVIILMSSVLINNYVLSRFLGICPFLGVSMLHLQVNHNFQTFRNEDLNIRFL